MTLESSQSNTKKKVNEKHLEYPKKLLYKYKSIKDKILDQKLDKITQDDFP